MSNFGQIIFIQQYKKITYYSIAINSEDALYDQFLERHTDENNNKLNHILSWLKELGDKVGAHDQYFRNEAETGDARALPPIGKNRKPVYVEYSEATKENVNTPNNLRLYCLRANEAVVFLFNGDIKTKQYPQDCGNVREHFKIANLLSKLLDQAFINKDIEWNEDWTDIIVDDDFVLEWD